MRITVTAIREKFLYILVFYGFFSTLITDYFHIGIVQYYDELVVAIECIWLLKKCKKWDIGIYIILMVSVLGMTGNLISKINVGVSYLGCYTIIKSYLMFYVFYYFNWKQSIISKILKTSKICYIILIFFGFLFYMIPSIAPFSVWGMNSICNHPAVFGTLMVPLVIYSVVKYIEEGNTKFIIIGVIALLCVFLAKTSKNLISLGLVMLIYIIKTRKKRKFLIIFAGALVIGLGINIIMGTLSQDINSYLLSASAISRPRTTMYITSLQIAKDYFPFGSGFGTFASTISRSHYSLIYYIYNLSDKNGFRPSDAFYATDSYWPAIIGETGFIGLLLFCYLLYRFLKVSIINFEYCDNNKERLLFSTAIMVFACLIIESLFTSTFMGLKCFYGIAILGIGNSILRQRVQNKKGNSAIYKNALR